jgi:hypothetical protein
MSKFFQALLSGIFFTYFIDFFLFLGVKQNYIDHYHIDVYYNILFADAQNIYIYALLTLIIGFITIYLKSNGFKLFIVGTLFFLSSATLFPPVGYRVGAELFMKKNITIKDKKHTFVGDILYISRDGIIFYDKELKKKIILDKSLLKTSKSELY